MGRAARYQICKQHRVNWRGLSGCSLHVVLSYASEARSGEHFTGQEQPAFIKRWTHHGS